MLTQSTPIYWCRMVLYRLYKPETQYHKGKHVRDLSKLNRDLSQVSRDLCSRHLDRQRPICLPASSLCTYWTVCRHTVSRYTRLPLLRNHRKWLNCKVEGQAKTKGRTIGDIAYYRAISCSYSGAHDFSTPRGLGVSAREHDQAQTMAALRQRHTRHLAAWPHPHAAGVCSRRCICMYVCCDCVYVCVFVYACMWQSLQLEILENLTELWAIRLLFSTV
jgi:hypothetical protein